MANGVSAISKVILDLLANSLFDANIDIDLSEFSLLDLYKEAQAQTVVALAFEGLPKSAEELRPSLYNKWQSHSFIIMHKNVTQMNANAKLEKLFNQAGIPICTIKGFAATYYYNSKKHLRQMGDIDFIVPADKIEQSKQVLESNGFIGLDEHEEHDFHLAYKKDNEVYEMHKGITSFLDENGYIEKYISDIYKGAFAADFGQIKITIPDSFAHGLVMLLHLQRHMLESSGVGFRHLCDWAAFVNNFENDEWKEIFEERLKSIGLWRFAMVLSKASAMFLKIKEKEWFAEIEESFAEELMTDIILAGNFGTKDGIRSQGAAFLSQTPAKSNKFLNFVKGYFKKVYGWKSFYEKHKIFLPVGCIAYFFRMVFLIVFKHKKLDVVHMYKVGDERNRLYNKIFK